MGVKVVGAEAWGIIGGILALFGWLLKDTQQKNASREEKYQRVIERNQQVISEQQSANSKLADAYEALAKLAAKVGQ